MELFWLGISIVNVNEDGILPKLSHFIFKMFKAFVPTKLIGGGAGFTMREKHHRSWFYHERKITVL